MTSAEGRTWDRLKTLNWMLLALLGVAAGVAKMMQVPQEMAFFQGELGFGSNTIVAFGALQFIGGLMIVFKKTRLAGSILLGLTLFLSSVVIFMSGNIGFGLVSLIPVVMADVVAWFEIKAMRSAE
ncbi:MAG: hypothetical protein ACR2QS_16100 [Woeseiaceae bacterium]